MSYPAYPGGYVYPNELIQGAEHGAVVWILIIAVYMTMIAIASGSFILLSAGVLFNSRSIARVSPALLVMGFSTALVMLLGPLADLRRPDHFYALFISPTYCRAQRSPEPH